MNTSPDVTNNPNSNKSALDLGTFFSHPAGLTIARHIVKGILIEARRQASMTSNNGAQLNTGAMDTNINRPLTESNPEMPGALKGVFALRDPEVVEIVEGSRSLQNFRVGLASVPGAAQYSATVDLASCGFPQNSTTVPSGFRIALGVHNGSHEVSDQSRVKITSARTDPLFFRSQDSCRDQSTALSNLPLRSQIQLNNPRALFSNTPTSHSLAQNNTEVQHNLPSLSQLDKSTRQPLPSTIPRFPKDLQRPLAFPHLRALTPANSLISSNPSSNPSFDRQGNPRHHTFTNSPVVSDPSINRLDNSRYLTITSSSILHSNPKPPSSIASSSIATVSQPPRSGTWTPVELQHTSQSLVSKMPSSKRKADSIKKSVTKKAKTDVVKAKKTLKTKAAKDKLARRRFPPEVWLRVLEFSSPAFLAKARLLSREFRDIIDQYANVFVNCRKENFGFDMPPPPDCLTERQYSNLLGGGKGCQSPGCNNRALRTHWSFVKRWCMACWRGKIEREDRAIKSRASILPRVTLDKLLECIPFSKQDSFIKPHGIDIPDPVDQRNTPRLYKCYLTQDLEAIIKEYNALSPAPYVENSAHTAAEKAAALAEYQALQAALAAKQAAFISDRKEKNDVHMDRVGKIEAGIKFRRCLTREPNDQHRAERRALFTRRARQDLDHIPIEFVHKTKCYKAATRIFRNGGTERGWQILKPKIVKEFEISRISKTTGGMDVESDDILPSFLDSDDDDEDDEDNEDEEEDNGDEDLDNDIEEITQAVASGNRVASQYQATSINSTGSLPIPFWLRADLHSSNMNPDMPRPTLEDSGPHTFANPSPNLERPNTHSNMQVNYPMAENRLSYAASSQQGLVAFHRSMSNSAQTQNSNRRMSISSLIQHPMPDWYVERRL